MRRILFAALVLFAAQVPAQAQERILNFISDVTVLANGDLDVTETITIQAEGSQFRRGIFRDFPTSYRRRSDGTIVIVGFEVISVTRNGRPEPYRTESYSNGVRTRIGSADVFIPRGQHTYSIRYRTTRQIGFFEKFDELYWNATGNGWAFTIDSAEARITLPPARRSGRTRSIPVRKARTARMRRSSSRLRTESCGAPRAACPRSTASPSRSRGRRASSRAERRAAGGLLSAGQFADPRRADRRHRNRFLLSLSLVAGRPRSAGRHRHSAVRAAERHVAGRGALRRSDEFRQSRLHRRDRRSRREGTYPHRRDAELFANLEARWRRAAETRRERDALATLRRRLSGRARAGQSQDRRRCEDRARKPSLRAIQRRAVQEQLRLVGARLSARAYCDRDDDLCDRIDQGRRRGRRRRHGHSDPVRASAGRLRRDDGGLQLTQALERVDRHREHHVAPDRGGRACLHLLPRWRR